MARTKTERLGEYERRYRTRRRARRPRLQSARAASPPASTTAENRIVAATEIRPKLDGPYVQWTAKVEDKTINRRLSARQAGLYREWIANDRRLQDVVDRMRTTAEATDLILEDADEVRRRFNRKLRTFLEIPRTAVIFAAYPEHQRIARGSGRRPCAAIPRNPGSYIRPASGLRKDRRCFGKLRAYLLRSA